MIGGQDVGGGGGGGNYRWGERGRERLPLSELRPREQGNRRDKRKTEEQRQIPGTSLCAVTVRHSCPPAV